MCGSSAVIPDGGEDVVMFLYGPQTRTFSGLWDFEESVKLTGLKSEVSR